MTNKLNILLFFAVHGRLDILKLCLQGITDLQNACKEKFNIYPFAVCSWQKDSEFLKAHNIDHMVFENDPLGAKKNAGLAAAINAFPQFDYMLEIGSDDIISPDLLEIYEPYMRKKVHMISCHRVFFLDVRTGQAATWTSDMIIGAGRCLSSEILNRMNKTEFMFTASVGELNASYYPKQITWLSRVSAQMYQKLGFGKATGNNVFVLWDPKKQSGLDTSSYNMCHRSGVCDHEQIKTEEPLIIDLKSADNLHSINEFTPVEMNVKTLLSHFSPLLNLEISKMIKGSNIKRGKRKKVTA